MKFRKYITLGLILSFSFLLYGCTDTTNTAEPSKKEEIIIDRKNKLTISAVGDVMMHNSQLNAQKQEDNSYNFDNNFRLIKEYIENSDLSIANLETTINTSKKISSYPSFNSPSEILDALKNTGFDIISTINNHSLDTGQSGISSTINEIKARELEYVGTQLDENEKNYITKEINGIKMGISSFSYADETNSNSFLNGIPSGKSRNLLNTIDKNNVTNAFNRIKEEITLMKNENCELIILNIHWGEEYIQTPSWYQQELARLLINEGVDIILGSHPHVVQPVEEITSDDGLHKGVVFYSLGNIISNQQEEEMGFNISENGLLPIIDLEKTNNDVKITNIQYIPTWVSRKPIDGPKKYEYTIVPLAGDLQELATKENLNIDDLITSFDNTVTVVNNPNIKVYNKEDLPSE